MDGKQGVLDDMGGERDEEHVIVEGLVFKVKLLLQMCVCVCQKGAQAAFCVVRVQGCRMSF